MCQTHSKKGLRNTWELIDSSGVAHESNNFSVNLGSKQRNSHLQLQDDRAFVDSFSYEKKWPIFCIKILITLSHVKNVSL